MRAESKRVAASLPESFPESKVCSNCKVEKPRAEFHKRRSYTKWILKSECKACTRILTRAWCHKNPERTKDRAREYHRRMASNAKLAAKLTPEQLDVARRMLIDHPQDLANEEERAAYARGFMAGAKRTHEEGEHFERLKDLCHRVASEGKVWGHAYEDRLSAAYEGLLAFIRGSHRRDFNDVEHERKVAAKAIRYSLMDHARANGPRTRGGAQRYQPAVGHADEEFCPLEASAVAPQSALPSEALDLIDIEPRSRAILEGILDGRTYKEMGEKFGITESRACKLAKEVGQDHPELESMLLAAL
jgi:hypothetical protein